MRAIEQTRKLELTDDVLPCNTDDVFLCDICNVVLVAEGRNGGRSSGPS